MRCSLARTDGHGTVYLMRELLILAIHLLVTVAKLLRPVVYLPSLQSPCC